MVELFMVNEKLFDELGGRIKEVLARTREKLVQLEARLAELEKGARREG